MDVAASGRGRELIAGGNDFASGALLARLAALLPGGLYRKWTQQLGGCLRQGTLALTLPDGQIWHFGDGTTGPQAQLTLHSWRALARLMLAGSVGWFDGWMLGEWESADPVALMALMSANRHHLGGTGRATGPLRWINRLHHRMRRNDRAGSRRNIHAHYDLGNDFYRSWLDTQMVYSSALFSGDPAQSLEDAQRAKIDAALDRLQLKPGDRLLEIGCGWGGLGARALQCFDIGYDGLTLAEEQAAWAWPLVAPAGGRILLQDYRDTDGRYDAIASIEMVEAVGREYWPDYLDAIARLLKPGGRAAIQYIAYDDALFDSYAANADFIQTYIFPGGCLISVREFRALAEARGLAWRDQRDFPRDYAETLRRWRMRYDAARSEAHIPQGFDHNFDRLWQFYLMYCEGGFRGGGITVAQVTLEKGV